VLNFLPFAASDPAAAFLPERRKLAQLLDQFL